MKKHLNPQLAFFGTLFCVDLLIAATIIFFIIYRDGGNKAAAIAFAAVFGALIISAFLMCAPTWYAYVRFDNGGVIFGAPMKKKKYIPFGAYGYIFDAYYINGKKYDFLVLSSRSLSEYERTHINKVKNCEKTLKFKCGTPACAELYLNLPSKLKRRADSILGNQNT